MLSGDAFWSKVFGDRILMEMTSIWRTKPLIVFLLGHVGASFEAEKKRKRSVRVDSLD